MTADLAAVLLALVEKLNTTVKEQQRTIDHLSEAVEEHQRILEQLK